MFLRSGANYKLKTPGCVKSTHVHATSHLGFLLWFVSSEVEVEPLVARHHLLDGGVVEAVGLVRHHPPAGYDLELWSGAVHSEF